MYHSMVVAIFLFRTISFHAMVGTIGDSYRHRTFLWNRMKG